MQREKSNFVLNLKRGEDEMKQKAIQILIKITQRSRNQNLFNGWLDAVPMEFLPLYGTMMPCLRSTNACQKLNRRRKAALEFQSRRKADHPITRSQMEKNAP